MTNTSKSKISSLSVLLVAIMLGVLMLSGCSAASPESDTSSGSSSEESPAAEEPASTLMEVEGRAVSASDTELVLRTADSELTFQIREEDVRAIDPEHIRSHLGIASIGFRAFYRNIDGVDYVVSIEEIDGTTLGFD